jgi:hypothetical protein
MKKSLLTLLISFILINLKAQEEERKGYIGIGVGVSFLSGYEKDLVKRVGTSLQLINFGFEIKKGFGVSALLASGVHLNNSKSNPTEDKSEVGYATLMVGPMYSLNFKNLILDFKARGGGFFVREKISYAFMTGFSQEIRGSIQYSFGISLRRNFAKLWCLTFSTDYFTGKSPGTLITTKQQLIAISSGVGIGFRL